VARHERDPPFVMNLVVSPRYCTGSAVRRRIRL
jgi:hypothetical protein